MDKSLTRATRDPVIIRTAQRFDIPEIAQVDVRSWRAAYTGLFPEGALDKLSIRRRMFWWSRVFRHRRPSEIMLVAELGGCVVGFCQAGPDSSTATTNGEIYTLYVNPSAWGRGVGSALLEMALTWLSPRYERAVLWVIRENAQARAFYEARGFEWDENSFRILPFFDYAAQCVRYSANLDGYLSYDWQSMFEPE